MNNISFIITIIIVISQVKKTGIGENFDCWWFVCTNSVLTACLLQTLMAAKTSQVLAHQSLSSHLSSKCVDSVDSATRVSFLWNFTYCSSIQPPCDVLCCTLNIGNFCLLQFGFLFPAQNASYFWSSKSCICWFFLWVNNTKLTLLFFVFGAYYPLKINRK